MLQWSESFRDYLRIVEPGDGIRFNPQSYVAGVLERVVSGLDCLAAVVIANDLVADRLRTQFVPFSTLRFAPANWLRRPFTT